MSKNINKTMNDFYYILMMKESSGIAQVVNKFGFAGLFQMGEMALDDIGYYDSNGKVIKWDGNGVLCTKYLKDFSGYDIDFTQQIKFGDLIIQNNASDSEIPNYQVEIDAVADLFELFDQPEIRNPALTNSERFRLLAKQEEERGDNKYGSMMNGLADQLDAALDFLAKPYLKANNHNDDEAPNS